MGALLIWCGKSESQVFLYIGSWRCTYYDEHYCPTSQDLQPSIHV